VAIGKFDGMHLGHRALFERLDGQGGVVVVEHYRATLTQGLYRAKFCEKPLFFYDFERIRGLDADAFVALLRAHFPNLVRIVVGEDFRFGAGRGGDADTLRRLFVGEVEVVPEVHWQDMPVHSRHIRDEVREGSLERANGMLGHPYETWGEVVTGQGLGARSLVPTLNLDTGRFLLPKSGVYGSRTQVAGRWYPSVSFVGHRTTTDGSFAVETHIVDERFEGRVGHGDVAIEWLTFLRENRRFESLEALKRQIERDIGAARER